MFETTRHFLYTHRWLALKKRRVSQINNKSTISKLRVPLTEPVSYHVKQELTLLLGAFHATPVSVPVTDTHNKVTYLSEHLIAGFMQPGQGSLSFGFPPSTSGNIHCKFSDRFIFRQVEHMAKETQLPKPDSFNKESCFCEVVDGSIWQPVDSPDV